MYDLSWFRVIRWGSWGKREKLFFWSLTNNCGGKSEKEYINKRIRVTSKVRVLKRNERKYSILKSKGRDPVVLPCSPVKL